MNAEKSSITYKSIRWSVVCAILLLTLLLAAAFTLLQPNNTYGLRGRIRREECLLLEKAAEGTMLDHHWGDSVCLDVYDIEGQRMLVHVGEPWMGLGTLHMTWGVLFPEHEYTALDLQIGLSKAEKDGEGNIVCDGDIMLLNTGIRDAYYDIYTAFRGGDYALDGAVWLHELEKDQLYAVVLAGESSAGRWALDMDKYFYLLNEDVGNIDWAESEAAYEE